MKFAVIDLETTGGAPRNNKIIEIAIVLSDGECVIDTFHSLVNPEMSIPPFITQMTGIHDVMVEKAPRFYEIARRVVELTNGTIMVAHNAQFDYGFLREEFRQLGYHFHLPTLCTLRLSRHYFPHLPSHSLESLIRHFGIQVKHRHRALDDALATAQIFHTILRRERFHTKPKHVLLRLQQICRIPHRITPDQLDRLPKACGVYIFKDHHERILYIGKSKNLRQRIRSHFRIQNPKHALLFQNVAKIDCALTGNELLALLLERELILKHRPSYNVLHKAPNSDYALIFQKKNLWDGQLRIVSFPDEIPPSAQILRYFKTRRSAQAYLARICTTYKLCTSQLQLEHLLKICPLHGHQCDRDISSTRDNEHLHNLERALQDIQITFREDFILDVEGRSSEERAAIYVSDGYVRGWRYYHTIDRRFTSDLFTLTHPAAANVVLLQYLKHSRNIERQPFHPQYPLNETTQSSR